MPPQPTILFCLNNNKQMINKNHIMWGLHQTYASLKTPLCSLCDQHQLSQIFIYQIIKLDSLSHIFALLFESSNPIREDKKHLGFEVTFFFFFLWFF